MAKMFYWYKTGDKIVMYDIVTIDGDYDTSRKQRLHQLRVYKEFSNIDNLLYSTGKPPYV